MPFPTKVKLYPKTKKTGGLLTKASGVLGSVSNQINKVPFLENTSIGKFSDSLANSSSMMTNIGDRANQAITNAVGGVIGDAIGKNSGSLGGAIGGELGQLIGDKMSSQLNGMLFGKDGGVKYYDGPASVLSGTGGLVFPNTPTVSTSTSANYDTYEMAHTNYAYYAYKNTKIDHITISAKFSCNTRMEADYLLGAIHFLRTVTKMTYGANDPTPGIPPPVLLLDALGPYGFNATPVIVTNFSNTFDENVDYVMSTSGTFVPALTTMSVTLGVYFNPSQLTNEFTSKDFRSGKLLKKGYI